MNWEAKRFSRIMTITKGEPITKASENEGVYPVILGGQEPAYFIDRYNHTGKAIVISRSGASAGYASFWNEPIFVTDGFIIDPIDNNCLEYIYYLLKYFRKALRDLQNGSAIPHVTPKTIYRLKAPIPPVNIQRRIADLLSAYDNLIEVNNKRIRLLEQMAENLYKEWFVCFRFPGYESAEFVKDNPRGWTLSTELVSRRPQNWYYGKFSEHGSFFRGKNLTAAEMKEGNIPVISAGIEPSGYHNESNVQGISLTISASGANAGYLRYNLYDIWASDCSYYQSNDRIWFAYNTLKFLQPVISNLQCGSAQPHVQPKQINRLSVIVPPVSIIHDYCSLVEPMYEEIRELMVANQNLIKQRDLLLPRLMSGKLEV